MKSLRIAAVDIRVERESIKTNIEKCFGSLPAHVLAPTMYVSPEKSRVRMNSTSSPVWPPLVMGASLTVLLASALTDHKITPSSSSSSSSSVEESKATEKRVASAFNRTYQRVTSLSPQGSFCRLCNNKEGSPETFVQEANGKSQHRERGARAGGGSAVLICCCLMFDVKKLEARGVGDEIKRAEKRGFWRKRRPVPSKPTQSCLHSSSLTLQSEARMPPEILDLLDNLQQRRYGGSEAEERERKGGR